MLSRRRAIAEGMELCPVTKMAGNIVLRVPGLALRHMEVVGRAGTAGVSAMGEASGGAGQSLMAEGLVGTGKRG